MGRIALRFEIPVIAYSIRFIGIHNKYVITTPNKPEVKPTITVSALNKPETFFFDAYTCNGHNYEIIALRTKHYDENDFDYLINKYCDNNTGGENK